MVFTALLREELAHAPPGARCCQVAETAALVRFAGALVLRGGREPGTATATLATTSGALVRRVIAAARSQGWASPQVEVVEAAGLQRALSYRVRLEGVERVLGLLDGDGRPLDVPPATLTDRPCDRTAYVRGALMAAGSVSEPHRVVHLEVTAATEPAARHLCTLLARCGAAGASVGRHGPRWRVAVKSGEHVGALLARSGAHTAFLRWDQARLRRELRADANRAANADRANLGRAVAASARQTAAIRSLVAAGVEELPAELAEVALARLANPEASLTELGRLLDPPVSKATVHRRLARLTDLVCQPGPRIRAPG